MFAGLRVSGLVGARTGRMDQDQVQPTQTAPAQALVRLMAVRLVHPCALSAIAFHLAIVGLAWWGLIHLIPDRVVLHALGNQHVLAEIHRKVIDRVAEVSVLLPAIFFFEYLWMGWSESSVRHLLLDCSASSWSDISCYLLSLGPISTLVTTVMSLGVAYLSGRWVKALFAHASGLHVDIASTPVPVQTGALLLLYSLFDYWSHRLDHSRLFWPLHRFHHSAESFSILTAARVHPAVFTAVLTTTLPAVLMGAAPEALADLALVIAIIRLVIHSRIDSGFGIIGRWMVQSPRHHRVHHGFNRMPVNVGLLPIWDHLFGTWREAPPSPMRIGTPTPYRHGAWIGPDVWRDYCEFWVGLRKLVLKQRPTLRLAASRS